MKRLAPWVLGRKPAMEEGAGQACGRGARWARRGAQGAGGRAGHMYLSGPQVQLLERRQFDEVLSAGTGYVGEGQTEVLQVSKGARAQQTSQVSILQTGRAGGVSGGLGLPAAPRGPKPPLPSPTESCGGEESMVQWVGTKRGVREGTTASTSPWWQLPSWRKPSEL